jgi:hypothetical protein
MSDVLLVFCPQQQGIEVEEIKDQLSRSGAHVVQQEANRDKGLGALRQRHFDFVIVGSRLAADRHSAVEEGGGFEFCKHARTFNTTPMMYLAPALTSDLLRQCNRIPDLVLHDDPSSAGSYAIELLSSTTRGGVPTVNPCLDIRVKADGQAWSFEMRGIGFEFRGGGDLRVSKAASMFWEAQDLEKPDWYAEFHRIGHSIRVSLCEENENFDLQLQAGKREAQLQLGAAGTRIPDRITFEVSESCYPLLLEAMFDPSPSRIPEPWLAQASSVARRLLVTEAGRGDLFSGSPAARRALLICADTHGTVYSDALKGGQLKLAPLTCVRGECERIRKVLVRDDPRTGQPLFYPHSVEVVGDKAPATRREIEAALRSGIWDLIHFAGHTYFQRHGAQQKSGTGFLFVGPQGEPECIDFGDIVSYMRQARFVYLSSCESGNSGFAALAAAAGINAVLGYRCKVNDRTAALQARLFYSTLQRSRSLGSSFGQMRRMVYRRYKHLDNAWASAMLVTPEHL